jgi:hypothetical protein
MNRAGFFLLAFGLIQMAGDVLHIPLLGGIGAATEASPAPKVFSSVRGLETFSTTFMIDWSDKSGLLHSTQLTPEMYSRLRGPYNRRNVYGAVLAYGPILRSESRTRTMFDSVAKYALCGDAPLLREMGLPVRDITGDISIRLLPRPGSKIEDLPLVISPPCQ